MLVPCDLTDSRGPVFRRRCLITLLTLLLMSYGVEANALQRHQLVPGAAPEERSQTAPAPQESQAPGAGSAGEERTPASKLELPHVPPPTQGGEPSHPVAPSPGTAPPPSIGHGLPGAEHGPGPAHGEEAAESHAEHGPPLPEISPVPGVTFVETMMKLMDYELNRRFLGWRPNDIFVGRFTDNVNNYQLGVLEAIRFTALRLKDSLTRMGDADAYDPDLEQALNLFSNRATLFWFPSAESSYNEAIAHLARFDGKLKSGQRNFYYRVDNLLTLLNTYKDLLGNVNRNLVGPVGFFDADDYFYYAKGVAHVYYEILRVVRVGYEKQLAGTLNALDIMDEIIHELYRAERMDPWFVLDAEPDSIFANHRANLNAPLSEVAHLLGVLGRF